MGYSAYLYVPVLVLGVIGWFVHVSVLVYVVKKLINVHKFLWNLVINIQNI
jgi:hypothetical protein